MCPTTSPGGLRSRRTWTLLGKATMTSRLWVEDRDTMSLEEVGRGLKSSPLQRP